MSTSKTPEERAKAYWIQCKNTGMRLYMAAAIEQAHLAGWHARDEGFADLQSRLDDEIRVNNAGAERERQWIRRSGEFQLERDKLRAEVVKLKERVAIHQVFEELRGLSKEEAKALIEFGISPQGQSRHITPEEVAFLRQMNKKPQAPDGEGSGK